ncbi:MAG: hypothetical protein IJ327_02805 [Lachnospiraceae bacterium]|nr:hypothetical protein [Lachnospiraceae bacterium]
MDLKNNKGNIEIIKDADGKNLVIVNDIRFKGRRGIAWKEVESYLKEYIGNYYEILETSERIYISRDLPDEFCFSKDTKALKGTNAKAKANAAQAIGELIQIATNRNISEDYEKKHGNRAKWGWYRYDARFALPVYSETAVLERYNIFSVRLLIRHARDGKLYLYDILRTKKETSKPPRQ